ncbi:MAG: TatD family hydrolase [Thermoflexibacter sp.]|jgi:TatD DNase family protein|nr:TatD family hydrolase [Thermoflexibacter sp.]
MQFIDTHAHIYSEQFQSDREKMLGRTFEADVTQILMPNIDSSSIEGMLALEQRYPNQCFPMMGLHPCSVDKDFEKELLVVEEWLSKRRFIAVGEMGIDLYWDKTFFEQQKEAFRIQANWAKSYQIPLVIHSREAIKEVILLLEELADERLFGVLHCFTGTVEEAKQLIALNFKLGIGGVVTYKNGGLEPVIKEIDLTHLVLETDSPYLAPIPHRGKRNETSYIPIIAQKIADIRNTTLDMVARQTTENAIRLFQLNKI